MNNDTQANNSFAMPDYFVVVKDNADKALAVFEQVEVNNNPIALDKLKTPDELMDQYAEFREASPEAGSVYIYSEFTHKYIKADDNNAVLKDAELRCRKFLDFCRLIGVKSVGYVSDENNRVDDSQKMEGKAKVGVKKVDIEAGGAYENSSKSHKKYELDYSFDAETIGEYDADKVENFYEANNLERLPEFSQLYNHWKQRNGGDLNIKLKYFSEASQHRSFAINIATAISGICDIKMNYQEQKDFENEKSLSRTINVSFFKIADYQKTKETGGIENHSKEKSKKNIYLWISIISVAFIAGAALCFCLLKFI